MIKERGFTLIELMVVIVIIGILCAVVIPNVLVGMGRGNTDVAEVKEAALAEVREVYPNNDIPNFNCKYEVEDGDYECNGVVMISGSPMPIEVDCDKRLFGGYICEIDN